MKLNRFLVIACPFLVAFSAWSQVVVKPVPWYPTASDPTSATSPHTVVTGTSAILAATVSLGGSTDSFTYSWNFGDGSAATAPAAVTTTGTAATVGNVYNLSATHTYPAATGVNYTAVLTVTDTNTSATYTGNYYVIVQSSSLSSAADQAIDNGLWYLHISMDRANTTNANSQTVAWGGWDGQLGNGCPAGGYACANYGGLDATNVQAFEVSGHYENGPSTDPYTEDAARGLARVMYYLIPYSTSSLQGAKSVTYNPALMAARCSDGSQPNYAAKTCATGTYINYNPSATSCTAPPCSFTYDGNSNAQLLYQGNDGGYPGYQMGMMLTAIVASQTPAAIAKTGVKASGGLPGVLGQTYKDIVQDLVDGIGYCQYYGDSENSNGYDNGGGWEYYCSATTSNNYDDNSPSQWNAIGLIAANRAFGITVPPIVTDTNQVWVTWSQDVSSSSKGQFGYDEWDYQPWGPFAVTPSGMVQFAMDGIGRTAAANADQRWNLAETYYRNNFCNTGGSTAAPRNYTYGLFSFTKAMELHDPGYVLTPITLLAQQPSGASPIDWYNAQASNGDACDGVAKTLVSRTNYNNVPGVWYGTDYESPQYYFETAWSIIMLQKTNFIQCVTNLSGVGKAGGRGNPIISLSWSGIGDASGYNVQRSSTSGGPYTTVGGTAGLAYNDQSSLVNGKTYYYQLQPTGTNGAAVCTSNQAVITIP